MGEPVAYLITFTTYGSRLHGDERGTVDSRSNMLGEPRIASNTPWREFEAGTLKAKPVVLTAGQREWALKALVDLCDVKSWWLGAANVRTNHIHFVAGFRGTPERAMTATKGAITAGLRAQGLLGGAERLWSRHGSTRYLWVDSAVDGAIRYVLEEQGMNLEGTFWPPAGSELEPLPREVG